MFGRRDPMRRYMDKIMAMIDDIGALCVRRYLHRVDTRVPSSDTALRER